LDILGSYVKDMPSLLDNLRNYMREDDIAGYQIAVHSVKSANRIIGAEELGARAEALETAAKNSDGDFIKEACPGFITAEERLIAKIASFLSRREEANPKPVKGEPDQAVLAELLEACKSLNIAGVNRAMEKLESFRYESRADLIPWLWEQIDVSDFSAMVERLSG
jgi:HPt (histidine-containing phosphotransfer) domain-containing protein